LEAYATAKLDTVPGSGTVVTSVTPVEKESNVGTGNVEAGTLYG
jgi:hypothetical protein